MRLTISTTEAELVAAQKGMSTEGIPASGLWEVVLNQPTPVMFYEDNSAAIRIIQSVVTARPFATQAGPTGSTYDSCTTA